MADDDETTSISSISGSEDAKERPTRLSIVERSKAPDDELLFSLTKKEEYVFRKSLGEMRWEEEERSEYDTETGESSDQQDNAAALLWERIGPPKAGAPPIIAVNDRRVSFNHPDPDQYDFVSREREESYQHVFKDDGTTNSSDSDPIQTIFDLLDDANKKRQNEADKKRDFTRVKLWRRRLIVVLLLNFVMRFRKRFMTFSELVVPIIVSLIFIFGMVKNSEVATGAWDQRHQEEKRKGEDPFEKLHTDTMLNAFCSNNEVCGKNSDRHFFLVYSPRTNFTESLILRAMKFLNYDLGDTRGVSKLMGVENASEVERICREHWNSYDLQIRASSAHTEDDNFGYASKKEESKEKQNLRFPYGIIFSFDNGLTSPRILQSINSDEEVPNTLIYTIRTYYIEIANTAETFPFRERKTIVPGTPDKLTSYFLTGVLGLQIAIDLAYAEKLLNKSLRHGDTHMLVGSSSETRIPRQTFFDRFLKEPTLKQFECPTYKSPELRLRGWISITMAIALSYMLCDICVAQEIVTEQQKGSIELLKIHGMTTSMRWIANLIITAVLRAITALAITLALHLEISNYSVAEYTHPLFLWLFLWMHGCTVTCFNYFITTGLGLKKAEMAGLVVVFVNFTTLLVPIYIHVEWNMSRFLNCVLCFFFPQWNLANGIYYYMRYELYEEGLDWYDFPVLVDTENHRIMPLPFSCNIFMYSTMLYLSLTIYMDHILPREFSPKENWLFFLQSCFRKSPAETFSTRPIPKHERPSVFEVGSRHAVFGPRIRNVTLCEQNKPTDLDNISLDIYEGEVTCLVGQIGSGKSDLLNCIAGVSVPSAGFVDVKGMKVHEYHDITNRYISLCPQKHLLMEYLSVEDHIRLCCMLHGASYEKAKTQATFLLKMFDLIPMRRHTCKGVTASDRKKLLVAMALSKSPSVLLLDNPMDELDPEARFDFWKLLQELKAQRSIVVSCTKLEEAQIYGDRIAILSKGKLICYGTPGYIKLAYGIGNVVNVHKAENANPDIEAIQEMMDKELLGAKTTLLETKGIPLEDDCIQFILPYGKFCSGVLEKLEDNMEKLKISKVSTSQPSLWALFHKIASHPGVEQMLARREVRHLKGTSLNENPNFEAALQTPIPIQKERKGSNMFGIYNILVRKKIWYYRQKYWIFLIGYLPQLLLLVQIVSFANLFMSSTPEGLPKEINIGLYPNSEVLFRSADNEHTRDGWEEAFKFVATEDDKDTRVRILDYQDDIEAYLAAGKYQTLTTYRNQTNFAFSRDSSGVVGFFSSNAIHAAPIAAHLVMQAFIYIMSEDKRNPHRTVFVSHPFSQYENFPSSSTQSNAVTILGCFTSVVLALLIVPSLRLILTEKHTNFKSLQRMAGVSGVAYWFSHAIADLFLNALLALICYMIVLFLDGIGQRLFVGGSNTVTLTLLSIFGIWLGWTALPYTYFVSQVVPGDMVGYVPYMLLHLLLGIVPKIITFQILRVHVSGFALVLRYLLYIFPPYSITSACVHFFQVVEGVKWCDGNKEYNEKLCDEFQDLQNLYSKPVDPTMEADIANRTLTLLSSINDNDVFPTCCTPFCQTVGTCFKPRIFFPSSDYNVTVPGLREDMAALAVGGLFYWILVIFVERRLVSGVVSYIVTKLCGDLEKTVASKDIKTSDEPEDVKQEHQKVDYMVEIDDDVNSEVYLVQDVTKFYIYTKGLDHVYFSVPKNSTTGILGLPKSGKTTMLRILTGQVTPSAGYVYKNNDLLEGKSRKQLLLDVGISPQKPAVLSYLTAAQNMTIMGKLRGLSSIECAQHVIWWLKLFGMQEIAGKKLTNLKPGQIRRLGCAMALIGGTKMVILDEPTLYLDNLEKYIFWNAVAKLPAVERTVLFTSTDAQEVQHHASKVLVLDSGSLVAVGHLTDIFKNHQGMLLFIRYGCTEASKKLTDFQKKAKLDKLKDHIIQYLSTCALLDEQDSLLIYHLKNQALKLSQIYAIMEGAKVKFASILDHFQVFEPSLDEIILQLHKAKIKQGSQL